jgi:predicted RNase H-like HicB family nuclease
MQTSFTLQYWRDGDWYVGQLKGVPGVFSQGETLEELEANIRDAYQMIMADECRAPKDAQIKPILIDA